MMENTGRLNESKRDAMIREHVHLVKIIAHQVAIHLPPHIDVDDLVSAGTIGLLEAIERFDESRGVQFKTYASIRIRGAIMDELRSMDWMSRSLREKSNKIEHAFMEIEKRTGRPAEHEEVASFLGINCEELDALLHQVSGLSVLNLEDLGINREEGLDILECLADPEGKDPVMVYKLNELKRVVGSAVEGLPDKEKLIVSLYYYNELTMKEIGKVMDITESRVCQLHSQTMHRLKGRLRSYNDIEESTGTE
ncbi:MAG TPA: FliA/WhiG family RNA polymerase sigma factor [Deltaproteobacteria bacterium]|nr:FliA/WhiG family RNA polymerase sigma factor [Deltaproteobacteria bacterium]